MPSGAFRFVHAGDFHLHQPLYGVSEVPAHLREAFVDAPYTAAAQVFQTCLDESVDFLVLTGDLVNPRRSGPRGPVFLAEWFEKLAARSIEIYWAGGVVDSPDDWPAEWLEMPILHRFGHDNIEEVMQQKAGAPLACILGCGGDDKRKIRASEYRTENTTLFTLASGHGYTDIASLAHASLRVNYWALGGRTQREQLINSASCVALYPGSPQGRCPEEVGAYGCTLVHVSDQGHIRTQQIATDALRWHTEKIEMHDAAKTTDLFAAMKDRAGSIQEVNGHRPTLVTWKIATGGPLGAKLRHGPMVEDFCEKMRREFGMDKTPLWTVNIEPESTPTFGHSYYEEETILGDFLRLARHHETVHDNEQSLTLAPYIDGRSDCETIADELELSDPTERVAVLKRAAVLGIDLLRGDWREEEEKSAKR